MGSLGRGEVKEGGSWGEQFRLWRWWGTQPSGSCPPQSLRGKGSETSLLELPSSTSKGRQAVSFFWTAPHLAPGLYEA